MTTIKYFTDFDSWRDAIDSMHPDSECNDYDDMICHYKEGNITIGAYDSNIHEGYVLPC